MTAALALLLAAAAWSPEPSELAPFVREALVHPLGPGTMAAAVVPATKPALEFDADEAKALGALIAPLDRGCLDGPSRAPAGVWWTDDLDGDGKPERLFSGGCSPAPFFAILRRGDAGWRLWASGRGRLLSATRTAERLVVVLSAWDGYGVARESGLAIAWVDAEGVVTRRELSVVGEQPSELQAPSMGTCAVAKKRVKLRSTPRVDDSAEESGMGFDWPGNLLQVLEPGSTGVPIAAHGGWSLCAFPAAPPPSEGPALVRAMKTAAARSVTGRTETFLLGWLPPAKR